jgi:tetratricopeptide (TPR) repeat protein
MKFIFLLSCYLVFILPASAQGYMNIDSARKLIRLGKTTEEKFRGMRSLDRFYYTTGKFDSSSLLQKEMFAIAKESKRDSMMALIYRAIGNRYVVKTDYNFSIVNYAKGLDYTTGDDQRRAGLYLNIAYVYIVTENTKVALEYIQKGKVIGQTGQNLYFENLLYGLIYNDLGKPDSALFYFRQAENLPIKITDPLLISVALLQTGKAYQLMGDADLAETYYKKTMAYCKEKYLPSSIIRAGNIYCYFLMKTGKYDEAKKIALASLEVAKRTDINEGIASVAEVLRKIYTHTTEKDSIIYYSQLQIDYKDSVSNQKKQSEFQNLTFSQQLHEIDEQARTKEAADEQRKNIQFVLMAFGIISFIIIFLLLSRSVITNTKMIEFLGVIALLIVFEFVNLLIHPFLERVTHHSPLVMLLALVCIAALLVPLHHRVEKLATAKLVEKNKQIRLAAAKKTIQQLETETDDN